MNAKTLILVSLVTVLMGTVAPHPVLGFMITPAQPGASTRFDAEEDYTLPLPDGRRGRTTLSPLSVTSIQRGGTAGFLRTLTAAFPGGAGGWTFTGAAADLAGSFDVVVYDAIGTATRVGADFRLHYNPGAPGTGDPTPAANELHWIQRVVTNHRIQTFKIGPGPGLANFRTVDFGHFRPKRSVVGQPQPQPGRGQIDNKINIVPFVPIISPFGQKNPFYDFPAGFFDADEDDFHDEPTRRDANQNHFWRAQLYLVELTAPRTVTIYNGVSWGWENRVPEPTTLALFGIGLLGLLVSAWRCRRPA